MNMVLQSRVKTIHLKQSQLMALKKGELIVGKRFIAACHDGHPGVILGLAMPRHAHGIRILMLIGADMTLTIKERLGNELGHMCNGMRAKDDIDVIDVGEQALAIALRDATTNGNHTLARG